MPLDKFTLSLTVAALLSFSGACDVLAADAPSSVATPPEKEARNSDWKTQTTLYLWATALEGSLGVGRLPNADLDITFADILKNLDGAVMGNFLVQNDRWLFLGDLVWADLSDTATLKVGNSPTLNYKQQLLIASAIGGYKIPLNIDALDLSVTAGLRYQRLSSKTTLRSGTFSRNVNRQNTEDWLDPIVGLALQYQINDRWTVNGITDIGGFGVGSQLTGQGFLSASYNWNDRISTALGYRAIYTNYESGSGTNRFDYEATMHGPFMSVGIHF